MRLVVQALVLASLLLAATLLRWLIVRNAWLPDTEEERLRNAVAVGPALGRHAEIDENREGLAGADQRLGRVGAGQEREVSHRPQPERRLLGKDLACRVTGL